MWNLGCYNGCNHLTPCPMSLISTDTPRVSVTDTYHIRPEMALQLVAFAYLGRDEFPQMAEAARDYLAIPASEVGYSISGEICLGSADI